MKRITKIESTGALAGTKKLRVAAYCRVSTENNEQLVSLETQKAHYESLIQSNEEWEYAGLYYDEGVSGLKTDKRIGLKQLLTDCENGKIDRIITKSISRFSRNTADCLTMVRDLLSRGISVYFEKENIDTTKMEGELLLSIMSSMAEDESASISSNVTWGVKKRFQEGTFKIGTPPYGYRNDNGKMVIVPEEAAVVKEIFQMILSGSGAHAIAKELNERGIKPQRGEVWHPRTIHGIVVNEKYTGDAVFQKTFTDDNFTRKVNNGERDQYFMEEHHEGIISHEDFERAGELILQRAHEKGNGENTQRYLNRYCFSGIIKCGECGGTFKRRRHYKPSGEYVAWTCNTHIENKDACSMLYVTDEAIKQAFIIMMGKLHFGRNSVLKPLVQALRGYTDKEKLQRAKEIDDLLEKNIEQRQVLAGLMTSGYLEPPVFNQEMEELMSEGNRLQSEKSVLFSTINGNLSQEEEAQKLLKFVSTELATEFDEDAFSEFVESATVLSRESIEFHLKCGLKLKERLVI